MKSHHYIFHCALGAKLRPAAGAKLRRAAVAALLIGLSLLGRAIAQEKAAPPVASQPLPGSADHSAFEFFAELELPATSDTPYFDFVLPASVFDGARYDLGDLRLYTADDQEVPFALRILRQGEESQPIATREFNHTHAKDGTAELTLDLGEDRHEHTEVEIHTSGKNFRRRTTVEGSSDQENWRSVVEKDLIKFQTPAGDVDDYKLSYPASRFRYLRIRVHPDPVVDAGRDTENVHLVKVVVNRRVVLPGEYLIASAELGEREPVRTSYRVPGSAWRIDLGGKNVPCEKLLLEIANAEFNREFEIQPIRPDVTSEMVEWANAYSGGNWRRAAGERVKPMEVDFQPGAVASRLKLSITDHANQPLQVMGVKYSAPVRQVVFTQSPNLKGPLRLYFGNSAALPPEYDFARNLPPKLEAQPQRLTVSHRQDNPAYIPPPKPLTERWPWLIYVVLGAVSIVLAGIIVGLGRAAVRRHDAQEPASTAGGVAH